MRFQLFLRLTGSTGEHRTFSPDGASPDIPESLSCEINGFSGTCYHDPQDRDSGMSGDAPSGENVRCSPVEPVSRKNSWNRISAKSIKLCGPY